MEGHEPDPRFTLANERTYLTWLSTSLALCAGGIAMAAVADGVFTPWLRDVLAVVLILLAAAAATLAYPRWRQVQRAMRRSEPLPAPRMAPVIGYGVAAVAVLALVMIVSGWW